MKLSVFWPEQVSRCFPSFFLICWLNLMCHWQRGILGCLEGASVVCSFYQMHQRSKTCLLQQTNVQVFYFSLCLQSLNCCRTGTSKARTMRGTVLPCAAASSLKGTSQDVWENSSKDALATAWVFYFSRLDIAILLLSSTLQGMITSYEPVNLLNHRT